MEKTFNDIHPFPGAHVHVIGIGGASMSGLARILRERGYTVSGSDRVENEAVQALRADGFRVAVGHRAENVRGADLVVYSSAIPEDHVERLACVREQIPCMERSELLGRISEGYGQTVCICGTHGKTTTTSMLAQILVETGADPSVHIGGVLNAIGGSVRVGESDLFLTEACEYRRSFLSLHPSLAVILNIDADHLDCYRDLDEIEEAFGSFLQKPPRTDGLSATERIPMIKMAFAVEEEMKNSRTRTIR